MLDDDTKSAIVRASGVGAAVLGVFIPPAAAATRLSVTLLTNFLDLLSKEERAHSLNELMRGIEDAVGPTKTVPDLGAVLGTAEAREAVRSALRVALQSGRPERAYRLGRVIGTTLKDERSFEDATEYILDIERLNEVDLGAIKRLWRFRRTALRVTGQDGQRYMAVDGET
jgi:hypothetical protein